MNYLERVLGLNPSADVDHQKLDDILADSKLTSLAPGKIAQIFWYARTKYIQAGETKSGTVNHAFLIGRLKSGNWFLSDQGQKPAFTLEQPDLPSLIKELKKAASEGRSWLDTSPTATRQLLTFAGIRIIGSPADMQKSLEQGQKDMVPAGKFLAEVDTGSITPGEKINAKAFVGSVTGTDPTAARSLFAGQSDSGFLIGEMPVGIYNVYTTTELFFEANLRGNIDVADSSKGLLVASPPIFEHAWLQLACSKVWAANLLKVY
ncbi:hypothetical protein [Polyangium fumosum]|uniref:Uncharacterized protein n=1 Tax=Polyangium fumosum TaxID=889272 RepID=A0A4U1JIJ2_9BACT|nr:hypothetical protein [Polyangium fumosum]TKD12478.1 hypothetical protein E8A74_05120 [Polyangium fumosum]